MGHKYIDTHAHLFEEYYKNDLDNVIIRARAVGVESIIVPGVNLITSMEAVRLAERYQFVYACIGIHPHEAVKANDRDLFEIERMSDHPKVVGIGEIGLDYHYDFSPSDTQKIIFSAQLQIAVKQNLPVVIHTRESFEDTYNIVSSITSDKVELMNDDIVSRRGVFHCFPEGVLEAEKVIKLGFFISFPGIVTFRKTKSTEVIKRIGLDNILLETDSPYMTPEPLRGKRNEPANIVYISEKIAQILNVSEDSVANVTKNNAIRLFKMTVSDV